MAMPGVGHTRGGEYQLVVRGELDTRFQYLFEPMRLERIDGKTVLSGHLIDQSQLHGVIGRIEELGLELLSVERMNEQS
jgi:hypothetical protein